MMGSQQCLTNGTKLVAKIFLLGLEFEVCEFFFVCVYTVCLLLWCVLWSGDSCAHATVCFTGLCTMCTYLLLCDGPHVFTPTDHSLYPDVCTVYSKMCSMYLVVYMCSPQQITASILMCILCTLRCVACTLWCILTPCCVTTRVCSL